MRLNTLRIPCLDLDKAEKNYVCILDSEKAFGSDQDGYIGFNIENVTILLEPIEAGEFESGRYLGFSLEVDDIRDYFSEKTESGIEFTGPPEKQAWGGVMTHVIVCSGNIFSIVQVNNV